MVCGAELCPVNCRSLSLFLPSSSLQRCWGESGWKSGELPSLGGVQAGAPSNSADKMWPGSLSPALCDIGQVFSRCWCLSCWVSTEVEISVLSLWFCNFPIWFSLSPLRVLLAGSCLWTGPLVALGSPLASSKSLHQYPPWFCCLFHSVPQSQGAGGG